MIEAFLRIYLGILLHNLSSRKQILNLPSAHKGKVSGLCFAEQDRLLSCGVDKNIKMWAVGSGSPQEVRRPEAMACLLMVNRLEAYYCFPW